MQKKISALKAALVGKYTIISSNKMISLSPSQVITIPKDKRDRNAGGTNYLLHSEIALVTFL